MLPVSYVVILTAILICERKKNVNSQKCQVFVFIFFMSAFHDLKAKCLSSTKHFLSFLDKSTGLNLHLVFLGVFLCFN